MNIGYEILVRVGFVGLLVLPWVWPGLRKWWSIKSESADFVKRTIHCPHCESDDYCGHHDYAHQLLVDHGPEAYRDYLAWTARNGYGPVMQMAMRAANEEEQSNARGS